MLVAVYLPRGNGVNPLLDQGRVEVFGPFADEKEASDWIGSQAGNRPGLMLLQPLVAPVFDRTPTALESVGRIVELSGKASLKPSFRDQLRRELASTTYDETKVRRIFNALNVAGGLEDQDGFDDDNDGAYVGTFVTLKTDGAEFCRVLADTDAGRALSQERAWAICNAAEAIRSLARLVSGPDWPPPVVKGDLLA